MLLFFGLFNEYDANTSTNTSSWDVLVGISPSRSDTSVSDNLAKFDEWANTFDSSDPLISAIDNYLEEDIDP